MTRSSVISTRGVVIGTNVLTRASLSVHCTDNEACTDKFCSNSESDRGPGALIHALPIICMWSNLFLYSSVSLAVSCARVATLGNPCFLSNWMRLFSVETAALAITRNASKILAPNVYG